MGTLPLCTKDVVISASHSLSSGPRMLLGILPAIKGLDPLLATD